MDRWSSGSGGDAGLGYAGLRKALECEGGKGRGGSRAKAAGRTGS